MHAAALRRSGLSLLGRRLGAPLSDGAAAAFTSSAAPESPKEKKRDPADDFIFKEKCKGTRQMSKDAEEVKKRLRRTNFGAPRKDRTGALGAVAPSGADVDRSTRPQAGGLHTAAASWAAQGGGSSAEDVAQELVETGSKKLMQSDDGREELRQGSFDLERTTERILEEGAKEASREAAERAAEQDVKDSVKSRVVSGSQTS